MKATLATLLFAAVAVQAGPTLVDRVAVTVANRAITETRVDEELRLAAFLNGEKPSLEGAARRAAADRLVERILLRREIEITGFTNGFADMAKDMFEAIRGRYLDAAAFEVALAEAKLTEAKLRENIDEQARMLLFIDFRFRPAVSVSDEEARAFYGSEYPAFWMALHPDMPQPPFDEARDDVDRLLVDRKVDAQMDEWLAAARGQVRIVYRDEVFAEASAGSKGAEAAK